MRATVTVKRAFEAAHRVTGHSRCDRPHGHAWIIELSVGGGLDPKRIQIVDHGELQSALDVLISEFADYNLNEMMPGVITTPEGVALYVRERLILEWPGIVGVTVSMGPNISAHINTENR